MSKKKKGGKKKDEPVFKLHEQDPADIWCNGGRTFIKELSVQEELGDYKKPKRMRCPVCRKVLIPKTVTTGGWWGEARLILPPHKNKKLTKKVRHFATSRDDRGRRR